MRSGPGTRSLLLGSGSLLVALAVQCATPTVVSAQTADQAPAQLEEVIVTGSRIASGFTTPTPVTATSSVQLKEAAPRNLAEGLVQLPTFNNSAQSQNPATAATGGTNGQNLLNLRGLGANRNLILLDGRRLPATNASGSVDVNMLPQNLVQRVDVVTGGASAAYGSDAVAGVVNFILDTKFEGLKGEVQGGISSHNDMQSGGASLAFGKAFLDGRLRLIGSAEYAKQDGISANQDTGRDWFDVAAGRIPNTTVGALPRFLVIPDIRSSLGSYGGLISSGPLRGTQFLAGGVPAPFNYGPIVSSTFMSGGDGARVNIGFAPEQLRASAFLHGEYDLTDDLKVFAEGLYAKGHVTAGNFVNPHTGAGNQFTIFRDNAFLPASILARMVTANVQSFPLGRYERDFPAVEIESLTDMKRLAVGVQGRLPNTWTWDASYSYGETNQELRENNLTINRRLYAAADAVRNPANGQIVCRSTLSGFDPGCVPLNLFGEGSPSAEAIAWVTGDSVKFLVLKQHVAQLNLSGDLGDRLSFGAGPISVATGLEYRKESADQTVDALSPLTTDFTGVRGFPVSQQGRPGSFNFFNPLPLAGEYDIKEVYGELGVPVFRDRAFGKSLDVSAAMRYADYSLSGGVTTWKYGFNYVVMDDVRLRYTKSRDIRGPNILELFNSATQNSNNQVWKGVSTPALTINSGNPDLDPETATTETYGVVYRPGWAPGLQASLDYYKIGIEGAIGNIPNIVLRCERGSALACAQITVTPASTLVIRSQVVNLNLVETAGYDFEVVYGTQVYDGDLSIRLLGNHQTLDATTVPGDAPVSNLDQPISPKWRGSLQIRYARDNWSLFVQERYIHKAKADPIEVDGVDTTDNTTPPIVYTSLGGTYSFKLNGQDQQLFFNINNLFDQDPPVAVGNPTSFSQPTSTAYDRIGRYVIVGLRFRW